MNVVCPQTGEAAPLLRLLSLGCGGGSGFSRAVLLLQVEPKQGNPGGNSCNGEGKMLKDKGDFGMVLGRKGKATEGMVPSLCWFKK